MLEIKHLSKKYGNKIVLDHFSCDFKVGINLLVGKNGSGKTTLFNTILGLESFSRGELLLNNKVFSKKIIEKEVSVALSEADSFFQHLTGGENLEFFQNLNMSKTHIKKTIEGFPLVENIYSELENLKFNFFSSGMKKKLNLLRAIQNSPKILFLDEPFIHLDTESIKAFVEYLEKKSKDMIIVIATHQQDLFNRVPHRTVRIGDAA